MDALTAPRSNLSEVLSATAAACDALSAADSSFSCTIASSLTRRAAAWVVACARDAHQCLGVLLATHPLRLYLPFEFGDLRLQQLHVLGMQRGLRLSPLQMLKPVVQ
jgi:hypothetical protein